MSDDDVRSHLRAMHGMGRVDLYGLDETALDNTHRYEHATRQQFLTHDHNPPWQQPVLFDQDAPA